MRELVRHEVQTLERYAHGELCRERSIERLDAFGSPHINETVETAFVGTAIHLHPLFDNVGRVHDAVMHDRRQAGCHYWKTTESRHSIGGHSGKEVDVESRSRLGWGWVAGAESPDENVGQAKDKSGSIRTAAPVLQAGDLDVFWSVQFLNR